MEIRADIRTLLRHWDELRQPITAYVTDPDVPEGQPRHHVVFHASERPRKIEGLRAGFKQLQLYDERIIEQTKDFAAKVWHLKDKLALWARLNRIPLDIDKYVNQHQSLCIVADLANANKHFENRNRSGLQPFVEIVNFDTSQCGAVEFFYDGATKEKEVVVTAPARINYTVALQAGGSETVLGDAIVTIYGAFTDWLPLIRRLRVLAGDNAEAVWLRTRLRL